MLSEAGYVIQYTDDDGEVSQLTSEGDLTEAICYFHSPLPPAPASQRASIGSFDSWQQRKITMYVDVVVDDDRFSISDLGSDSTRPPSVVQHRSGARPTSGGGWGHLPLAAIAERGSSSNITPDGDDTLDEEVRASRRRDGV